MSDESDYAWREFLSQQEPVSLVIENPKFNNEYTNIWEKQCLVILEAILGIPFIKSRPSWLMREPGYPMELDFYNQEHKLAFEYQELHHFQPVTYRNFDKVIRNDKSKIAICKERGVRLFHIPDCKDKCLLVDIILTLVEDKLSPELNAVVKKFIKSKC